VGLFRVIQPTVEALQVGVLSTSLPKTIEALVRDHSPTLKDGTFEVGGAIMVSTRERVNNGRALVLPGDWLVKEGSLLHVVPDEMFKHTFEEVSSG
jgi:hypothetical protein